VAGGPPMMSGNFNMTATSQTSPSQFFIGGALQSDAGGVVTAGMLIINLNNSCFDNVTFSGTVNNKGELSLTGRNANGLVISVAGKVSGDGKTISNGSYTITHSPCLPPGDGGTLVGSVVQLMSGTYSGSYVMNGSTMNASLTIKAFPADNNGNYAVQVSGAYSNTAACGGFTTSNTFEGGDQNGLYVSAPMLTHGGVSSSLTFSGLATDATAKTINGTFAIGGGPCDQMHAQAMLTAP